MNDKPRSAIRSARTLRLPAALLVLVALVLVALSARAVLGDEPQNANDPAIAAPSGSTAGVASSAVGLDGVVLPDCGELVATINGECVTMDPIPASVVSAEVGAAATGGSRRLVYLTSANHLGNTPKTACAAGFHMASLWEILDTSSWVYATAQPGAYNRTDSGGGPPAYWYGWIRTGFDSSIDAVAGTGNCANWSSSSASSYGTSVRLTKAWESAPGEIGTWDATAFACSMVGPVWCMED